MIVLHPVDAAREALRTLVVLYARGLREPMYFFPKSAWAYLGDGENAARARSAWQASDRNQFAESADPAYRLALRGLPDPMDEGWDAFDASARAVFEPLLAHCERVH